MGFGYGRGVDEGAYHSRRLSNLYGGKPKKTVFDTSQCAHVWAQQSQDWGRNAKGTVFFERETIYSYGHHFPMARFIRPNVVLVNSAKFSVSTSSHQRDVESAIRHKKTFEVRNVKAATKSEHESNLAEYKSAFASAEKTARNTRVKAGSRKWALQSMPGIMSAANEYARLFLRKRKPVLELPADFDWLESQIDKDQSTRDQKDALREFARASSIHAKMRGARHVVRETFKAKRLDAAFVPIDAKRFLRVWHAARKAYAFLDFACKPDRNHAIWTAQANHYGDKNALKLHRGFDYSRPRGFVRFDNFAQRIKTDAEIEAERLQRAQWQRQWDAEIAQREKQRAEEQGARERLKNASIDELREHWRQTGIDATSKQSLHDSPCMLRLNGDVIFTSWGANFPAEHARRAWPAIKRVFASGTAWQTNGHKIPLGHFQVDSISTSGELRAGCHTLTRAEIERCAAELGLS